MRKFTVLLVGAAMAALVLAVAGVAWAAGGDSATSDPPYDCDTQMQTVGIKPAVYAMNPGKGCTIDDTTPTIRAIVTDGDSNLRKRNIRLFFDGTRVSNADFSYSRSTDTLRWVKSEPVATAGEHTAKITAKDKDGRKGSRTWTFTIAP